MQRQWGKIFWCMIRGRIRTLPPERRIYPAGPYQTLRFCRINPAFHPLFISHGGSVRMHPRFDIFLHFYQSQSRFDVVTPIGITKGLYYETLLTLDFLRARRFGL
jgi:hypothetical protein